MHSRSAEATAANKSVIYFYYGSTSLNISISSFRSFLISIVSSGTFPMIETYGVVVTNTASALVAWLGFG